MSRIYLNSPIEKLGRKEAVRIGNMVFTWCKKNMGVNNRKQYELTHYFTDWHDDKNVCGEYDDSSNEVFIYYKNLKDVREMIATIIHEWKHTLQPLRTQYQKYKGPYKGNPFEIEARRAEKLFLKPCWESIKNKVNKNR
jgi:hypothetical protein